MNQPKRIFIIGHSGAGKALVAKALAKKLGWQSINADLGLETHIWRPLVEILGEQGEEAFYQCQSEILSYQLTKENIVVATDASIVSNERTRELLSSEFLVYLKVSTPVQLQRTARNPDPLLPITDRKAFLDKLHAERDALYDEVSTLSVDSDHNAIEDHVMNITNAFEK